MICASRHLPAFSKNHVLGISTKQVKGVLVMNVKAWPARPGGSSDDGFCLGGSGSDPSHILAIKCWAYPVAVVVTTLCPLAISLETRTRKSSGLKFVN